jgi:predicted membrane protein (TIGR00267 family)
VIAFLRRVGKENRLPIILGLTDGLLNALTLAASSLLGSGGSPSTGLAVRIGVAALATAAFTMFVADYAERRAHLVRAGRELNLTSRGHLATTRLGRRAVRRSLTAMVLASVTSYLGASVPIMVGAVIPGPPWIVVVLALAVLTGLGAALAKTFAAHVVRWAGAMAVGGVLVTWIGTLVHIT